MLRAAQTECVPVYDECGNEYFIDIAGFEAQDVYEMISTKDGVKRCQLFINSNDETDQVWV